MSSYTKVQLIRLRGLFKMSEINNYYKQIAEWCDENCISPDPWYYDQDAVYICFKNPEDATLFALTFAI